MSDTYFHGRIVAMDLILRAIVTQTLMESGKGAVAALQMRDEMFASFQLIQRDIGDYEDKVWDEAVKALDEFFGQVAQRIEYLGER